MIFLWELESWPSGNGGQVPFHPFPIGRAQHRCFRGEEISRIRPPHLKTTALPLALSNISCKHSILQGGAVLKLRTLTWDQPDLT